jgi:transcriptional regulator with XRE-family HTH domain
MNQTELAELAGVQKGAQVNYEAGKRAPDANYMAAIAMAGADVLYILTGQRSQPVPASAALAPRERALLDNYEHADESGKKIIEGTASLAAQSDKRKKA